MALEMSTRVALEKKTSQRCVCMYVNDLSSPYTAGEKLFHSLYILYIHIHTLLILWPIATVTYFPSLCTCR